MTCSYCSGTGKVSSGAGNWMERCPSCNGSGSTPDETGYAPRGTGGSESGSARWKEIVGGILVVGLLYYFWRHPQVLNGIRSFFVHLIDRAASL